MKPVRRRGRYVLKRPGCDEFLRVVGELFEVVLFTASLSKVLPLCVCVCVCLCMCCVCMASLRGAVCEPASGPVGHWPRHPKAPIPRVLRVP